MAGPDERPDAPQAVPERLPPTITVPTQLVDGIVGLLNALQVLLQMDEQLSAEESKAKQLGMLQAVRGLREVRAQWRRAITPLIKAYEMASGQKFPKGPDVGRITREQAQVLGPVMMPGASFLAIGEGAAARLMAAVGLRKAATKVAATGIEVKAAAKAGTSLMGRLAARGTLPAAASAGLLAAFQSCGKFAGIGAGVLVALKLVGSKFGKQALADAAPFALAVVGVLFILRRKGR